MKLDHINNNNNNNPICKAPECKKTSVALLNITQLPLFPVTDRPLLLMKAVVLLLLLLLLLSLLSLLLSNLIQTHETGLKHYTNISF